MGKRSNTRPRCERCGTHLELCVCAYLEPVKLDCELWLVQNNHERNKPTNTGRLALHAFEGAGLSRYAVRGESFDPSPLARDDRRYALLFPREGAQVLRPDLLEGERPLRLVVLDGTWGQCSRMSRRVPGLADMPAYTLPELPASHWGVRRASDPSRVSTFEAIVHAVETLHGDDRCADLKRFFDRLCAAMLFMKGKLPSPEVPEVWPIEGGVAKREGL